MTKCNCCNGTKSEYTYYTQNVHGDAVNLTNAEGAVVKNYKYDTSHYLMGETYVGGE